MSNNKANGLSVKGESTLPLNLLAWREGQDRCMKMSEQEIRILKNKFRLWKIMHSGDKTHYCQHCKYNNGSCASMRKQRNLLVLGFCHIFLMEENYVK